MALMGDIQEESERPCEALGGTRTRISRSRLEQTAAEQLYRQSCDPQTFYFLAPSKAIRVHASTRFELKPGTHSLTAHAELLKLSDGRSEALGTAESVTVEVEKELSPAGPRCPIEDPRCIRASLIVDETRRG